MNKEVTVEDIEKAKKDRKRRDRFWFWLDALAITLGLLFGYFFIKN